MAIDESANGKVGSDVGTKSILCAINIHLEIEDGGHMLLRPSVLD
jgi:hypothetical protein